MAGKTHKQSKVKKTAEAKKQLSFVESEAINENSEVLIPVETADLGASEDLALTEKIEEEKVVEAPTDRVEVTEGSVKAKTHARRKSKGEKLQLIEPNVPQKNWYKVAGLVVGFVALCTLLASGFFSQYYKNKTLPNISVAGVASSAKTTEQLKTQLEAQKKALNITFSSEQKKFEPKDEEIGLTFDVNQTIQNALHAKRDDGIFTKIAFWKKVSVPVVVSVNDSLLQQYVESKTPTLSRAPQDSQLQFNAPTNNFIISKQADGQGADTAKLKNEILTYSSSLQSKNLELGVAKKGPTITEAKLKPLLTPANNFITRKIALSGLGFTYQARPSDIAVWITPTPQKDGTVTLEVDSAKVQSYVDTISKKISSIPVDRKIVKDEVSGVEVVLQEGRDGTELTDKTTLASAIVEAVKAGQDTTQTMKITAAAFKTVNMNAYDKWIEIDLSEQRTTAYERASPVKNYIIASGIRGHETVTGEFAIWHKVRTQTMQGGSKADGSYYNIANVEWVSYFYQDYALHGAWWRKQFGAPASHGCVNMTNADAQWVFEWAPLGTKVIVHA